MIKIKINMQQLFNLNDFNQKSQDRQVFRCFTENGVIFVIKRVLFDEDPYTLVVICLKKSALQILSDAGFFTNGKTSCLANL